MNYNMLNSLMNMGKSQPNPPIDESRFRQMASGLTKEDLIQLVNKARLQGITEDQIDQGLNFLLSLK